ncbi:ABC transporter permease [Fulvivirgaceae bacterium BMA12]|uniref:ABC transporter permease n=1 Tax=Agaribacillus aureus TaxID=3051825 RepID=A0ABT8L6N3_9BACT|nr:ABC transporter permease [Fulvivirgaceae bacterium BMA12]
MKKKNQPSPPLWATKFLRWYCNKQILEDLEGDIHEYYLRNIHTKGVRMARLIYILDVLKFFRIYTIRKPKVTTVMSHGLLLQNYLKTSSRNLRHNPLFSLINVVGLAISMSVGLLLVAFISEINTFDTFHKDAERIYRVNNSYAYLGKENNSRYASTSPIAGERIRESISGIEHLLILRRNPDRDITYQDKTVPLEFLWTSDEFFNIFSFQLLEGNPATALKELNSLVITDKAATKLFGDKSAINKQVTLDDEIYTITGIVAAPPLNSHLQFEVLASYTTYANANKENDNFYQWWNMWNHYVYFKLKKGQDPLTIQAGLDRISAVENNKIENTVIQMYMQPLLGIIPGDNLNNTIGTSMERKMVWMLLLLAIIVMISACFNYTNLSLGRSIRRSMEVGIRKVNGASRFQVWLQFIVEATIISLVALTVAIGLYMVLRNYFFIIDQRMDHIVTLELTLPLMGYFVLLALCVGLLAGFFPALFFSRVPVFKVLKDLSKSKVLGQISYKKILILIQYTISLTFIVAVTLIYKQYRYSVSFDLGYNTENIINLKLFGEDPAPLINKLRQFPEIKRLSRSGLVTSTGNYWAKRVKYQDPLDSASVHYNEVDENYLPIHGHKFLAGSNFIKGSEHDSAENNQVIVNEALLKRFEIGTPIQAIGEEILVMGEKKIIQGVLKDFHYGTVYSDISPFVFVYERPRYGYLNLSVSTTDIFTMMEKIENAWEKVDPVHPMSASFYEDQIKEIYNEEASMITIVGFIAFLAISIASLGLLGMVIFTIESRLKEISIRKVFGASEMNLIYKLGKGFIVLLLLAAVIAIPAAYYYVNTIIFEEVVYKTSFGFFDIVPGVLIVFGIAFLMVCYETLRAARSNPATILRNE